VAVNTTWTDPSLSKAAGGLDLATGDTVDETTWDKMASDLYHLGKTSGYIGARAYNSGNLTIPNGVATALTFDSERFDSDTIHSVAVSTGRLTCQTAGVYHIMGQVRWAVDADGYRAAYIRLNGATTIASVIHVSASAGVSNDIIVSCHYQLALNDYVELVVYHTAGGDLAVAAIGNYSPEFSMVKA